MLKRIKRKSIYKVVFVIIIIWLTVNIANISYAEEEEEDEFYVWADEATEEGKTVETPEVLSRSAVVFDRKSKTVIWGKNEMQEVPMASTTKIMTAIILCENITPEKMKETVEVCQEAALTNGSSMGIKTGDKVTYHDLLYGLMLPSGNDAAVQIAISVAGSVENFADLMNKKAAELGLEHTHFVTPHGLDRDGHYTTAKELAIITDYAMQNPIIAKAASTKNYTVTINGYPKNLNNSNELLGYLEGVTGVKTGYTSKAGRCLVTAVNRNGFEIISVVLGSDTKKIRTKDSIKLIEYAYKNYELKDIESLVQEEYKNWCNLNQKRLYVYKGIKTNPEVYLSEVQNKIYPLRKDENIGLESDVKTDYEAPLPQDTVVGKIAIQKGEEVIEEIEIKTKEEIKRKEIKEYFVQFMEMLKQVI